MLKQIKLHKDKTDFLWFHFVKCGEDNWKNRAEEQGAWVTDLRLTKFIGNGIPSV